MSQKIYTRKGDKGNTSLLGGKRVPKYHLRVEAYGTIDELKSYLGLIRDSHDKDVHNKSIYKIQEDLMTIEALLACENKNNTIPEISEEDVKFLEKEIDKMNEVLPRIKAFIIPGGNIASTHAHVARCICRRAERIVVKLSSKVHVEEIILKYLNRLSDYLFVLARFLFLNKR